MLARTGAMPGDLRSIVENFQDKGWDTYTGFDGSVLGDGKSREVVTLGDWEAADSLHFN